MSSTVTVLMTVFNGEQYLPMTIESVLRQTHRNFQFLIIDDASKDRTVELIRSYQDPRIHLHVNPQNLGQTRSLNVGLQMAKTDYVARIDADDVAFPHWLERLLSWVQKYPQDVVISPKAAVIDENNRIVKKLYTPDSREEMVLRALTATPINHVGSILKRSVVLQNGGYDEQYRISADYALWSRLISRRYALRNVPDLLMKIRIHQASMSLSEINTTHYKETSAIIFQNIAGYTTDHVTQEQAGLLWKFTYAVGHLSHLEFIQAREIFERAYFHLRPEFQVSSEMIEELLRAFLLRVYIKKIFAACAAQKIREVRWLVRDYGKRYAPKKILWPFYGASFLGKPAIKILPVVYEKLSQILALGLLKVAVRAK